jgi:hypothetical protein
MNPELDYDLTLEQWETLKALRIPSRERRRLNHLVVEELIGLGLATVHDDGPSITRWGRKVLIRGSSRLWDVAA